MRHTGRGLVLAIVLAGLVSVSSVGAETLVGIAAVVNDEAITSYQLDKQVDEAITDLKRQGKVLSPQERGILRQKVLDGLIDEILIRHRGKQLGIEVGEVEVDAAITDILQQNKMTHSQLEEALKAQKIPFSEYRKGLAGQILRVRVTGQEMQSMVEITTREVRDYYEEHLDEFRQDPSITLSYLVFQEILQAREARKRLDKGDDFDQLLQEYSGEASVMGGPMGTFNEADLSPLVAGGVQGLKVGETSGVIDAGKKIYLIHVDEKSQGKPRPFEDVQKMIESRLQDVKRREGYQLWQQTLRDRAHIEVR